jgi:hypothetical protein
VTLEIHIWVPNGIARWAKTAKRNKKLRALQMKFSLLEVVEPLYKEDFCLLHQSMNARNK